MKHREVVLFAVGLMSDPTPLVDYAYQIMINHKLAVLRNEEYSVTTIRNDHDLLKSLYIESEIQLPGHPLHNQHINYYNFFGDDREIRSRDTTAIYFPSKLYVFRNIKHDIVLGPEHREQEADIPECTLMISFHNPDEAVKQNLLSICQVIMRNQAIKDLFVENVKPTDLPQKFAFNISNYIQLLCLERCDIPSQTLNHLMEQINECRALRKIVLRKTNLRGVSSLTLSNKTSLTHLDLCRTHMSRDLSRSVCHQLADLTQLKHLDLSRNDLSQVDMIHLSNKPNLSCLNCCDTQMSTKLSKNVMGQISYITHLSILELSWNTLTGCLTSFLPDPHPRLPGLVDLCLQSTALNTEDLQYLFSIIQNNKLPKLRELDLSHNTLTECLCDLLPDPHPGLPELEDLYLAGTVLNKDDLAHLTHLIQTRKIPGLHILALDLLRLSEMETDVGHFIDTCVNHHQRGLKLWLSLNGLSEAFEKKWKERCAGTKIELVSHSLNTNTQTTCIKVSEPWW